MTDFDAETAMAVGGWDPGYAGVLDVQVDGDVAAALVDANGDGANINIDIYVRSRDGGWSEVASGDGDMGIPGWEASSEDAAPRAAQDHVRLAPDRWVRDERWRVVERENAESIPAGSGDGTLILMSGRAKRRGSTPADADRPMCTRCHLSDGSMSS